MSGIALIFQGDGAPVAPVDLEAMVAAMDHRAVDGARLELDGPIGVGFCSMITTAAHRSERQPVRCLGGSTIVAFDGRLDDRQGLRQRLGVGLRSDCSDLALVAHAIRRWGNSFVNHLIGDYAIVVADVATRRVLCARDHLGVRPLYYCRAGSTFVAASDVRAVLAHPSVSDELRPAAFEPWAEHWIVPEGTIYRDIFPLPMASFVEMSPTGWRGPTRYWNPSCEPYRSRTADEYLDEYRWLLKEAIRDRLWSSGPVVVGMSGGLDSTTVASMALKIAQAEPGMPEIRLGSLVFPGHPRADESKLIDSMERTLGTTVRRTRPRARTPSELAEEIIRYRELPDPPNDMLDATVHPELGERVLLTGLGGDDWFYRPLSVEIFRAVRHGRVAAAVEIARAGKTEGCYDSVLDAVWRQGFRRLATVPGSFLGRSAVLSRVVASVAGNRGSRLLEASWCPRGVPLDTASVLASSRHPILGARLGVIERRAAHAGFQHRHPLHDVRLIELSLRLPGNFRVVDGDGRWLPRRAMEGALPDDVRLRRTKAEFSIIVREELAGAAGLIEPAVRAASKLDLERAWLEMSALPPDSWHPQLTALWSAVVAEIWRSTIGSGFGGARQDQTLT